MAQVDNHTYLQVTCRVASLVNRYYLFEVTYPRRNIYNGDFNAK